MSAGAFSFRADDWRDISHDAKDLIKKLLKKTVKVPLLREERCTHVLRFRNVEHSMRRF